MNNRFNLYLHVHKGLRAFMADVLTTVGRIDALDAVEVTAGVAGSGSAGCVLRSPLH